MKYLALIAVLILAGCSSEAERLERQYEIVSGNRDKCEAASKVADAYLRQENETEYSRWRSKVAMDCFRATMP